MTRLPTYPESHPAHPCTSLRPFQGPGLFITGTGTDIGKTTVTAALAGALHRLHVRVARANRLRRVVRSTAIAGTMRTSR